MSWRRGTVTAPQENRAIIIEDGDRRETRYRARYANCEPEAADYDRLREGEKVLFRSSYFGNDQYGASEIWRVERLGIATLVDVADILIKRGDILRGKHDEYQLEAPLGRGATGQVWQALGQKSKLHVAAKILSPVPRLIQASKLDNISHRFEREAKLGAKINHPNVVRYIDTGKYYAFPFSCLELCERSISPELEDGTRITLERSVEIITQVVAALSCLHDDHMVHRDVKPQNMLVRPNGTVCLGDLGILRAEEIDANATTLLILTDLNTLGSWFYMAPEQRQAAGSVGPTADIYSLGVSWYEMLTGVLPAPERIAGGDLSNPIARPHPFNELIKRMMAYRANLRPTMGQLLRCLSFSTPTYANEVAVVIRAGLADQRHPSADEQCIAATYRVLPILGFPQDRVNEFLGSAGVRTPPTLVDTEGRVVEDGTAQATQALLELAEWAAEALIDRAMAIGPDERTGMADGA